MAYLCISDNISGNTGLNILEDNSVKPTKKDTAPTYQSGSDQKGKGKKLCNQHGTAGKSNSGSQHYATSFCT